MEKVMVPGNVVLMDLLIYWILSMIVIFVIDRYARWRLGGAKELGYLVLRIPRFITMIVVSSVTVGFYFVFWLGHKEISYTTETFLGIPYFAMWVFFLVCVFRRIRAEKARRL